jgi:biopolymer transport protein ExbB/TolQ
MSFLFAAAGFDFAPIAEFIGNADYGALALVALWGAYCCIVLWRRVAQLSFANEELQTEFLDEVQNLLKENKKEDIEDLCEGDGRGVVSLTLLALKNQNIPLPKLKILLLERFQRDILADLDGRVTWVGTIIKAAPMLGLFGTVVGMMGAFGKLAQASEVSPDKLANDIMLALITTALGLMIAIPLVLAMASIAIRIARLEDLVSSALTRLLDIFGKK